MNTVTKPCPDCGGAGFRTRLRERPCGCGFERVYRRCATCKGKRYYLGLDNKEAFDKWWHDVGSGIRPIKDEDHEEFAHRIARFAFNEAVKQLEAMIENIPTPVHR